MKKILIAGGTGFVGGYLTAHLRKIGYELHLLTRTPKDQSSSGIKYFEWDLKKSFIDINAFNGVDTIINLTGENISAGRWTSSRRLELIESRVLSLNLLFEYVKRHDLNIDKIISSSAVGYYGAYTSDTILSEDSNSGNDFLAHICKVWEKAAWQFESLGAKTIILRKGIVLGRDGGMYSKLAPLAKLGINVSLGDGKQYIPWIDIHDVVRLYEFILDRTDIRGVYNAVAPQHITMNDFAYVLLRSFGRSSFLPNVPGFVIKLLYGDMAAMLLNGSPISAEKIRNRGFKFNYDTIARSLNNCSKSFFI
ncbi:TIGR01777 family oxidoreductase [Sphingobacterium multivorum]|uniref:TIGR01777 family oxidoreductase n=1 Tax=Sphingobacterium multivorum TaxID=28454 RepID=UPI00301A552F